MKKMLLALSIILCFCLSGCMSGTGNKAEDLLLAPQMSKTQMQVTNTLNDYLGNNVELKYPRQGENLSPFLFIDMDGDKTDEVLVTFTTGEGSKNSQLALLKIQENGKWKVVFETEGKNTDIDKVVFANLFNDTQTQIIVGYTNLNLSDKYMVVYNFGDNKLTSIYEQPYFQFDIADITADGQTDIVAVSSPIQMGRLQLSLIEAVGGELKPPQVTDLDIRFNQCTGFGISKSLWRGRCVVLDGYVSSQSIASEVLYFNGEIFKRCNVTGNVGIPDVSEREYLNIKSIDIDKDGTIEVPVMDKNKDDICDDARFSFMSWYEFDEKQAFEEIYGLVDVQQGYFLQLPMRWKNEITITKGPEDDLWLVRDKETETVLMFIRLALQGEDVSQGGDSRYTQVAVLGNYRLYIYVTEYAGSIDPNRIYKGVTRLA